MRRALLAILALAVMNCTSVGPPPSAPKRDEALRTELLEMANADQQLRNARPRDPEAIRAADVRNTRRLKEIITTRGWPIASLAGADGAHAAWIIAQHADADVAFQMDVLRRMEQYTGTAEVRGDDYAYLRDRVATNDKQPQRFGTQGRCTAPHTWEPQELENPKLVDKWRASMGLEPLADYVAMMSRLCP